MGRIAYSFLYYLILPLILFRLVWRAKKAPAYRERWQERLGRLPKTACLRVWHHKASKGARVVWVHAVSVGETIAAVPLVRLMQKVHPDWLVVMTCMTPTGSERIGQIFGDTVVHVYAPYDTPGAVNGFLRVVQPDMLLIMETELWPNMVHYTHQRQVPVILVNGRMSERSARGYQRLPWLIRPMMANMARLLVQTEDHAKRFETLGACPRQVQVTGSIKFDLDVPASVHLEGKKLRRRLGESRPVWIGASTHEGEDALLLGVHQRLLAIWPELCLILVPRHPERFEAVCRMVAQTGFTYQRQSDVVSRSESIGTSQVHVGDTMGQLMLLYAASDFAFVGGSLVQTGGHNPIEPAALGLPVLMGPHTFNFEEICQRLQSDGGLLQVPDEKALEQALKGLLDHPAKATLMGRSALDFVERNRGALNLCLRALESELSG